MKKLAIINSFPSTSPVGGAEVFQKNLTIGLQSRGFDINTYSFAADTPSMKLLAGGVLSKGLYAKLRLLLTELFGTAAINRLIADLNVYTPDVILVNNFRGFGEKLFPSLRAAFPDHRLILVVHDYGLLCYRNTTFKKKLSKACAKRCKECVLFRHNAQKAFDAIDTLIFPSEAARRRFSQFLDISTTPFNKYVVIPHGLEIKNRFGSSQHRETNGNCLYVGFLGALESHKGILDFLKIAAIVRQSKKSIHFAVAGSGSLVDTVRSNENVEWLGQVAGTKKQEFLQKIDVLVVPSKWHEIFGLVVVEAMQSAVVVCGYTIGAPQEIAEIEPGHFVPQGDYHALADWITGLSKDQLKLLSQKSLELGKSYQAETMLDSYAEFLYK